MTYSAKISLAILSFVMYAGGAAGAVTAEEAAQLGATLMPWGAERAGNKEGTIPEWTGPIKPENYDPNKSGRPDPFAHEKPLFSIDGKNMEQYADKLTEGTKALLKKYPSYRLDIYPSHRTANYPKLFQENAIKNATSCKTANEELTLKDCYAGTPFPIPKTGSEVMWNRTLKFDAYSSHTKAMNSFLVDPNGNVTAAGTYDLWNYNPVFDPDRTSMIGDREIYARFRYDYWSPARKAGEKLVIHHNIDMANEKARAWTYLPGQRRVKLSPDVAYDTPIPVGGTAAVNDEAAVFFGSLDRYDFKLIGKAEKYIPYNTYKMRDLSVCSAEVVAPKHHVNPDCVRWELHRVWVVEATVKKGLRHLYPKRTFYWDEDLSGAGMGDNYDAAGELYRTNHSLPISYYEAEGLGHSTDPFVVYDLSNGYYTLQMFSMDPKGYQITDAPPLHFFSPEALAGAGVR